MLPGGDGRIQAFPVLSARPLPALPVERWGQVVAGLRGGAGLEEFRAGIEAGRRALGNRAFLRWVGELQSGGRDAPAQAGAAPLQLGPKKRKHPDTGAEAGPGASALGFAPADAGTGGPGASGAARRSRGQTGAGSAGDTEVRSP